MMKDSAIIYVGHLPRGFYEKALTGYFSQFGKVTGVDCARSKKTGGYKGYAFIRFQSEKVAKIAAEATNNYILNKSCLKSNLLTPDEAQGRHFRNFRRPPLVNKTVQRSNTSALVGLSKKSISKTTGKYSRLSKVLSDIGISYDFIPLELEQRENLLEKQGERKAHLKQFLDKRFEAKKAILNKLSKLRSEKKKRRQQNQPKRKLTPAEIRRAKKVSRKSLKKPLDMNKSVDTFEKAIEILGEQTREEVAECEAGSDQEAELEVKDDPPQVENTDMTDEADADCSSDDSNTISLDKIKDDCKIKPSKKAVHNLRRRAKAVKYNYLS